MTRGRNLDELAKEQGFLGATNLVRFPASTVTTHGQIQDRSCMAFFRPQSQALTRRAWTHGRAVKPFFGAEFVYDVS